MKKVMTIEEFLNQDENNYAICIPMASLFEDIEKSVDAIKQFCDTTGEFFQTMGKVMHYLLNPKELAWMMWSGLVANSLEICLLLCLLSTMAWLIGWNKGKKIATGSILVYGVIQAINVGVK